VSLAAQHAFVAGDGAEGAPAWTASP